mmetsp:Transcript_14389/g.42833  ORF Transcript_14389/g.42833 Transcript_14389/m.42833 type:complete len:202 (+) Transcript_14389:1022-1627(+)
MLCLPRSNACPALVALDQVTVWQPCGSCSSCRRARTAPSWDRLVPGRAASQCGSRLPRTVRTWCCMSSQRTSESCTPLARMSTTPVWRPSRARTTRRRTSPIWPSREATTAGTLLQPPAIYVSVGTWSSELTCLARLWDPAGRTPVAGSQWPLHGERMARPTTSTSCQARSVEWSHVRSLGVSSAPSVSVSSCRTARTFAA